MNVVHSTTPKGEKPTDNSLKACWENFNWQTAQEYVNRLQSRITKATLKQNWNLVKRLQYLLTHSFFAKMIATQTVSKNKGKRTAGIDGIIWTTPETKMTSAISLSSKNYKAQPLRRVYIDKYGKKEKRPLSIPTMHDRAMQALYALALSPVAEATADKRSFGFRKYRSTQDACGQTFTYLCRDYSAQWILEGDISGCFAVDEKLYSGLRSIRHSIHSERLYSDVHLWQRVCAKLRGQCGARVNLTAPNC